jgi:flagellar biogenesis protein FliO
MKHAQSSLLKIVLYLAITILIIIVAVWVLMSVKGAGTPNYFQNILRGK